MKSIKNHAIAIGFLMANLLFSANAHAQNACLAFDWAVGGSHLNGSPSFSHANSIAVDAQGNLYVAGRINGTVTFGNTTLTSSGGSEDIFVAKLNSQGQWLWAVKNAGNNNDYVTSIVVDGQGNIFLTGFFHATVTFGNTTLTSSGSYDVFVAKLNSQGQWIWSVKAGGSSYDYGNSIAVDGQGDVYVTGSFSNTVPFGNTSLTSSNLTDVFVAKLNSQGQWLWAVKAGGTDQDYGNSIAVDGQGDIFLTGKFRGTATFGNSGVTSSGLDDVFVAKLNSQGQWLWAVKAGGSLNDYGNSIAVDGQGYILFH